MPNRIIKESICTSDSLAELSWFEQNVFFRLIVLADDYGIYDARPAIIRGRAYPLHSVTDKQISDALSKLATVDMIYLYTVGGKPYLQLKTWGEHQQIRATKSKYPKPDEADLQTSDINCNQVISSDSKCPRNPIQSNPNPNPISKADKPQHTRSYGEYGWVKLTEEQYQKLISDLGKVEVDRCIKYIDESAQSSGNKNKWRDWNLVVRRCNREGWGKTDGLAKKANTMTVSEHPAGPTTAETERLKRYAESLKGG